MEQKERKNVGERKIKVSEIILRCLLKWRMIICFMLIFATLLGGIGYYKSVKYVEEQKKISLNENEKIDYEEKLQSLGLNDEQVDDAEKVAGILYGYELSYAQQQEYMADSIYMNLDGNKVPTITLCYYIDNHYQTEYPVIESKDTTGDIKLAIYAKIHCDEIYNEIAQELNIKGKENYIGELITLNDTVENKDVALADGTNTLALTLLGADQTSVSDMSLIVQKAIADAVPEMRKVFGDFEIKKISENYSLVYNGELINLQKSAATNLLGMRNNIADMKSKLDASVLNYAELRLRQLMEQSDSTEVKELTALNKQTIELSPQINKKYVVFGAFVGALIVVAWIVLGALLNDTLVDERDLELNFEQNVLGKIRMPKKEKKRIFSCIDRLIVELWSGKEEKISLEESIHIVVAKIILSIKNDKKLLITTTSIDDYGIESIEKLISELKNQGIHSEFVTNFLTDSKAMLQSADYEKVLVVETVRKSKYRDIDNELQVLESLNKKVIGCMVVC